jgi:hypothetical protein
MLSVGRAEASMKTERRQLAPEYARNSMQKDVNFTST